MLKILQARIQKYVNQEISDIQARFRKGRGTRDQIANIHYIIEKAREFQKNIYFCFTDYKKTFNFVNHNILKILKEMGIPDYLTSLPRNLYAGQEATVRTGHGTTDCFKIEKDCILSPCLFDFYAEYTMWNARMDDSQAGIKTAGRNINNLTYAYDTTLMAESEKNQRAFLRVKEESEKAEHRSLVGHSPWGRKRVRYNLAVKQQHTMKYVYEITFPTNRHNCPRS